MIPRVRQIITAWAVGWLVYMIAMVLTVYDGILSLIFQPIMACLASAVAVGTCLALGLVFRVPAIGQLWRKNRWMAGGIGFLSAFLMLFGNSVGLTEQYADPETGRQVTGLHSGIAFASYFLLIFSIANFPVRDCHEQ